MESGQKAKRGTNVSSKKKFGSEHGADDARLEERDAENQENVERTRRGSKKERERNQHTERRREE